MTAPAVLVRADASPAIGMGHAMRCLALAEVFTQRTRGLATFLMSDPPPAFAVRAAEAGATVRRLTAARGSAHDAQETLAVGRAVGAAWIVLDGYDFDGGFQARLAAGGRRVLALDDHGHAGHYAADLLLNQSAGADAALYRDRRSGTRLLLGPRFALLREEFRRWPGRRRPVPARARRVVVTFGGSDPDNVSALALEGLAAVPGPLEILLLVGPANLHRAALDVAVARCPHPVEVAFDVRDMAQRLAWADIAVAAAGGTVWELARVGTPLVAIVLADNQEPGAAALAAMGLAINLGRYTDLDCAAIGAAVDALADDADRRSELSRRGRQLVDGEGAARVLAAMAVADESEVAA